MSASPDHPDFTAYVLGEKTTSSGRAAFEAALLGDPVCRAEAVGIQRAADRLAAALKSEPALQLTLAQRHAVLNPRAGTTAAAAAAVSASVGPPAGISRPAKLAKTGRPAWVGTTLATAGIAAALVLGMNVFQAGRSGTETDGASGSKEIPTVAIQPVKPSAGAGAVPGHGAGAGVNPVLVNAGGGTGAGADGQAALPLPTPGLPGAGAVAGAGAPGKAWESIAAQPPVLPVLPPGRGAETPAAPAAQGTPKAPAGEYASPRTKLPGGKQLSGGALAAPASVPAPPAVPAPVPAPEAAPAPTKK